MWISVVPTEGTYHVVDRTITPYHLNVKMGFGQLLEMYFEYMSSELKVLNEANACTVYNAMYGFYSALIKNGIPCGIIAFDYNIINDFYNKKLECLGIDIVNDCFESPLHEMHSGFSSEHLNENQLCDDLAQYNAILSIMPNDFIQQQPYVPCYVYRIIC